MMDSWDKTLSAITDFYKDLGVDTQRNSQLVNSALQALKDSLSSVNISPAKQNFDKYLNPQSAQKSFQDFKQGALGVLKPKGVAIALGALLGGGGAVVYSLMKNRKYNKEYERAPQLKHAANLGRLYSGAILGGLAGLLLNKYKNKLHEAATNWFTKHKEYL